MEKDYSLQFLTPYFVWVSTYNVKYNIGKTKS